MPSFIQKHAISHVISDLIAECRQLPNTDVDSELFQEKNLKSIMLPYFEHLLSLCDDPELIRRLAECDLGGPALLVYRRINAGGHPVRDYLILTAAGLNA